MFATKHDLNLLRRDLDINTITVNRTRDSLKNDINEIKELLFEMTEQRNHSLKGNGKYSTSYMVMVQKDN